MLLLSWTGHRFHKLKPSSRRIPGGGRGLFSQQPQCVYKLPMRSSAAVKYGVNCRSRPAEGAKCLCGKAASDLHPVSDQVRILIWWLCITPWRFNSTMLLPRSITQVIDLLEGLRCLDLPLLCERIIEVPIRDWLVSAARQKDGSFCSRKSPLPEDAQTDEGDALDETPTGGSRPVPAMWQWFKLFECFFFPQFT